MPRPFLFVSFLAIVESRHHLIDVDGFTVHVVGGTGGFDLLEFAFGKEFPVIFDDDTANGFSFTHDGALFQTKFILGLLTTFFKEKNHGFCLVVF